MTVCCVFDPQDQPLTVTIRSNRDAAIAHAERHTGKGWWKLASAGYTVREVYVDPLEFV